MSETSFVTCCPECQTRFSVSEGQLKIAAGKVRCGVCLQVFDAKKFTYQPPQAKPSHASPSTIRQRQIERPLTHKEPLDRSTDSVSTATPLTATRDARFVSRAKTTPKAKLHIPVEKISLSPAQQNQTSSLITKLFTSTISLLLVALLIAQVSWFKRTDWLNEPALRPFYAFFYDLADATLPARSAPELVRTYQLTLQPHEYHKDALRISLLIENSASFAQPFPSLQLEFMDVKGRNIAQRRFAPADYINADLFPDNVIPSQQPIQIQLDILNPGRRAVSYQVKLIPDSKNG